MTPPERARDPNTPPDELARLARVIPDDVLANPVLGLLALADPVGWGELVGKARRLAAEKRTERLLEQASKAQRWRFHLEAVAHASRYASEELRPLLARCEQGLLQSATKADRRIEAAFDAIHGRQPSGGDAVQRDLVAAMRHLATGGSRRFVRSRCTDAAGHAAVLAGACRWFAEADEAEWQLAALSAIFAGPPRPPEGGVSARQQRSKRR